MIYLPGGATKHPMTGIWISHFLSQMTKGRHLTHNKSESQREKVAQSIRAARAGRAGIEAPGLQMSGQCSFCAEHVFSVWATSLL